MHAVDYLLLTSWAFAKVLGSFMFMSMLNVTQTKSPN